MKAYAGIRVAVFGSSGFTGRWVARKLSQAGAELLLPVRNPVEARNIFPRFGVHGELIDLDLTDIDRVSMFYRTTRPSITFNLAGYGVDRRENDPAVAYKVNAELPVVIADCVSQVRDARWGGLDIVHAGTAMEYGTADSDLREDTIAMPTTLYGKSKLAGTTELMRSCEAHRLRSATARLFSVYGPGEHAGRLLPSLLEAMKTGDELQLTDGMHERDFVYVEDVADGLLRLGLESNASGKIVNIATGRLTSVRSFTEIAAEMIGIKRDRLCFGTIPTRPEEMHHKPVSNRRLQQLTSWTPPTAIADGVRKTMAFSDIDRSVNASVAVEMR